MLLVEMRLREAERIPSSVVERTFSLDRRVGVSQECYEGRTRCKKSSFLVWRGRGGETIRWATEKKGDWIE